MGTPGWLGAAGLSTVLRCGAGRGCSAASPPVLAMPSNASAARHLFIREGTSPEGTVSCPIAPVPVAAKRCPSSSAQVGGGAAVDQHVVLEGWKSGEVGGEYEGLGEAGPASTTGAAKTARW